MFINYSRYFISSKAHWQVLRFCYPIGLNFFWGLCFNPIHTGHFPFALSSILSQPLWATKGWTWLLCNLDAETQHAAVSSECLVGLFSGLCWLLCWLEEVWSKKRSGLESRKSLQVFLINSHLIIMHLSSAYHLNKGPEKMPLETLVWYETLNIVFLHVVPLHVHCTCSC